MLRALLGENPFDPGRRPVQATVRLRHDVTAARAQAALALEPFDTRVRGRRDPVRAELLQHATPVRLTWSGLALLSPVFIAFGLVLAAASANASNVMLARANARHREIGIRLSIGAGRGRIVRQLVTEGLLLAMLAGAAGLALAGLLRTLGTVVIVAMLPPTVAARARIIPLDFDWRVILFTCLLAAAVTSATPFAFYIEPPSRPVAGDTIREMRSLGALNEAALPMTVVGVAADTVNGFVYQGVDSGHLYLPANINGSRARALLVRGRTSPPSLDAVRAALQRVNPDPLAFDVLPIDDMVQLQLFPMRAASYIGTLLSGIALVFSVSGLYGVLTYTFGQRKQEIGIRMALGASMSAVERMVFAQSARLASAGTVFGLLLAFAMMKLLSRFVRLANVSVVDPLAFAASVSVIAAAVALASYGPARRAARIDPSSMLRADA